MVLPLPAIVTFDAAAQSVSEPSGATMMIVAGSGWTIRSTAAKMRDALNARTTSAAAAAAAIQRLLRRESRASGTDMICEGSVAPGVFIVPDIGSIGSAGGDRQASNV
jgi:hypothetical protein